MSSVTTYSSALRERMNSMASSLQDIFDGGESVKLDIARYMQLFWSLVKIHPENTAMKGKTAVYI